MTHPERIGSYRIVSLLGSGGMAHVFRAVDETNGATVAIKLLHPHAAASPAVRLSFADEVRLGQSLHHPGLVPVHAAGEEDGQH